MSIRIVGVLVCTEMVLNTDSKIAPVVSGMVDSDDFKAGLAALEEWRERFPTIDASCNLGYTAVMESVRMTVARECNREEKLVTVDECTFNGAVWRIRFTGRIVSENSDESWAWELYYNIEPK